ASLTQSGFIAGTPRYMSPEQANGEPVDHRSDLFSLGSVLYEMCTGRPPFRAPNTAAVLRRVSEEAPRPVREVNPDAPGPLCRVTPRPAAQEPGRPPRLGEGCGRPAGGVAGGLESGDLPCACAGPALDGARCPTAGGAGRSPSRVVPPVAMGRRGAG